ncbi:hypothetical protein BGZ70_000260 [Mortierella alpina]|uniref:Aminoglycoside phosphotransferase domain-containing protein n=1 Tax=Mortierella alpina TaxID=64518 RepID=A0A9P6IYT7_MORAP|nr:hypothetical protein BGZ70_000260 [Mortierella alpina]
MSADPTVVPILATADEAELATHLYTETEGPRKGIILSFEKARRLIEFHLPGKQLDQLFYFKRGYNNRVYLAQCADASEYVIRLGGRFWDHKKITNEVLALQLARKALGNVVEVPKIVGTSTEEARVHTEEGSRIVPHDYIIMTRLPGIPLDTVWDSLSLSDKKQIADQVAEIFARLRTIELYAVGNFVRGPTGEPEVGPMMEGGGGPFLSWREFVAGNIQQEIKNMLAQETNFVEIKDHLPRLETLVHKIQSAELEARFGSQASAPGLARERPISFLHGDFESRNMLVVGTQIVGLHDFEFAGGFPSEQEWCAGFEWLFARSEDPYDAGEQQKLKDMTKDEHELLDYFLRTMKDKHGLVPFGPDNQEYKAILYHLQSNIAPWWLREAHRDQWTEQQRQSMRTAAASLDKALTFLGC